MIPVLIDLQTFHRVVCRGRDNKYKRVRELSPDTFIFFCIKNRLFDDGYRTFFSGGRRRLRNGFIAECTGTDRRIAFRNT